MNALWCLWFASSIAMPFFLGFSEAAGTVAYAGSYGFAALGILVGLWLSSCPTVQKYQVEHNKLPLCLLVLGLVITLALWPAEIARFFLLEGANLPAWLLHANAVLVPMENPSHSSTPCCVGSPPIFRRRNRAAPIADEKSQLPSWDLSRGSRADGHGHFSCPAPLSLSRQSTTVSARRISGPTACLCLSEPASLSPVCLSGLASHTGCRRDMTRISSPMSSAPFVWESWPGALSRVSAPPCSKYLCQVRLQHWRYKLHASPQSGRSRGHHARSRPGIAANKTGMPLVSMNRIPFQPIL